MAARTTATSPTTTTRIVLAEVLYAAERVLCARGICYFDAWDCQVEAIFYAANPSIDGLDERGRHRTYRI